MKKQNGFTLVEVMVAVLVLAIGLLGLAHLQISSLKVNQSAESRSHASILAADIFESMRANQAAATNGDYILAGCPVPDPDPTSLAETELSEWCNRVDRAMPNGNGSIACPAFVANTEFVCTITVNWTEIQDDDVLGTTGFVFSGAL